MVEDERRCGMSCEAARDLIHRFLDGELMDAVRREELDEHLESCAHCRRAREELGAVQSALEALPEIPLPDAALREVWKRTTRSGPARPARHWLAWRPAAAAAALALALYAAWSVEGVRTEPTSEEVARAVEETRMVLGLTARALRDARQAAVQDVLADEVSPALRRVPIRWPGETDKERREPGNGV